MLDLKACLVCFNTEGKLYQFDGGQLKLDYCLVSGLKVGDLMGMPNYLCVECASSVGRYKKFRDKCKRAHFALKELLQSNKQISKCDLEAINREYIGVMPSLSFLDLSRVHYETVQFKWKKECRNILDICDKIPVFFCSTVPIEKEFEVPSKRARLSSTSVKEEFDELILSNDEVAVDTQDGAVPCTSTNDDADFYFDNGHIDSDNDNDLEGDGVHKEENDSKEVDGMNLEQEYASVVPLTIVEARAAVEIYKMFSSGKFRCEVCSKSFISEKRYKAHVRMHDQHFSGSFRCSLCLMCYKTDFLLKTHMTEKHMYKYICKKCPEVSFDRTSAKQHFIWTHLQKGNKKDAVWYDCRPSWLSNKGGKRRKGTASLRPVRKIKKLPPDFPIYTPIRQEEQYELIKDRKKSRNYTEANFKCELCFRGFREPNTYAKHMRKHDASYSGNLQCDMCKVYFVNARKMYKHMIITHVYKYSCQMCSFVCYNRGQAHMHYRWHKDVTYSCPHCVRVFKKASTRLTHIRIKHPSSNICNMCGHSFVSESGLYCHKRLSHSTEEIAASEDTKVDASDPQYCAECDLQFLSEAAYRTHLGSSVKHATTNLSMKMGIKWYPKSGYKKRGRPRNGSEIVNNGLPTTTQCEVCKLDLPNDVMARKHYEAEHPGHEYLKRYMCDVCGHTTRQYANLMVHMRTHTHEKPYGCPHCDRRFSMTSNRDRHIVVHTGEKKYQCQHCNRRFTQSSAVKLHIQTVHLKIPYAPWDKKNRKRRKELEGASAPSAVSCPPPKVLLDSGDYLNAYITYNDE